jgi:hypothetical protein
MIPCGFLTTPCKNILMHRQHLTVLYILPPLLGIQLSTCDKLVIVCHGAILSRGGIIGQTLALHLLLLCHLGQLHRPFTIFKATLGFILLLASRKGQTT